MTPLVHIDEALCVRLRHASAECRACSTACPDQAITIEEGQPWLQAQRCSGCQACVKACPTGAMVAETEWPASEFLAKATGGSVRAACPHAQAAPEDLRVPCLRAFPEWAAMTAALCGCHEIHLACGHCAQCPKAAAAPTAQETAARIAAWAKALGIALSCTLQETGEELRSGRRRLLGRLLRPAPAEPAEEKAKREPRTAFYVNPASDTSRHAVPAARERLAAALCGLLAQAPAEAASRPLAGLVRPSITGQQCAVCGLCAAVCPSGAITQETGSISDIWIKPQACTGCGACRQVCWKKAIELVPATAGEIASGKRIPVFGTDWGKPSGSTAEWEGKLKGFFDCPIYRT